MFIKWPKIENSYRQKYIDMVLGDCPGIGDKQFWISEKLHGSSLQLFFEPEHPVRVGSRNRFLDPKEKFYDVWNTLRKYQPLINAFSQFARMADVSYRVFCEYYGDKIQKGVDYGDAHKIAIFGLMENDDLLCPQIMNAMLFNMGFEKLLVPELGIVSSLDKALAFPTMFDSCIRGISDNICEGVVIRPYNAVYYNHFGNAFMLKKKNEAFKERQKAKKPPKEIDSKLGRLNAEFKAYITDMRLQGIFSKYGEIETPKQIGQYIGYMMRDAKEDFLADNPDVNKATKKDQKYVFNVGAMIANMLKLYL